MTRNRRRMFGSDGRLEGDPDEKPDETALVKVAPLRPGSLSLEDAAKLGDDYKKAQERHRTADADATREGYERDWRKFEGYCLERGVKALPAHPELVATYMSWLADTAWNGHNGRLGYKPATLQRARAAIASEHRKAGLSSPCSDDRVKRVIKSIKRDKGSAQRRAWPIMPEHLRAIFAWIDAKGKPVRGLRDKAILLAGWAGGLRREELVALRREDVRIHEQNVIFFIRRSKTDQEGKGAHVDFSRDERLDVTCPIRFLGEWDRALSNEEGEGEPFLRRVRGEEILQDSISDKKVERLVCAGAKAIGLDPRKYSAHSLRAGIATWLIYVADRIPWDVKKHLRHKSVAMLDVYVRDWDRIPGNGSNAHSA